MTAGRKRKLAIRARMAETGEPYSVAASAVDAERQADGAAAGEHEGEEEQ